MPRYLFVTGKLAAGSLRACLENIPDIGYEISVLPISVAALMTTQWIARHLSDARACRQVIIPGLCRGDLLTVQERVGVEVIRGPKDLKDLPGFFGL